jgi:predicted  nucleic acid-binding Zn-ribbon protein
MNTKTTPETDAEEIIITKGKPTYWVSKEFARRLERERDEWKAKYIHLKSQLTQTQGCVTISRNGYVQELEQELAEARKEIELLKTNLEISFRQTEQAVQDRAEEHKTITEQRDRLAAVLQRIRDGYGGQVASPNCCADCDYLLPIDEALQSLTLNKP